MRAARPLSPSLNPPLSHLNSPLCVILNTHNSASCTVCLLSELFAQPAEFLRALCEMRRIFLIRRCVCYLYIFAADTFLSALNGKSSEHTFKLRGAQREIISHRGLSKKRKSFHCAGGTLHHFSAIRGKAESSIMIDSINKVALDLFLLFPGKLSRLMAGYKNHSLP